MKNASRVQAIIEILDEVLEDKAPADSLIDRYFKSRRYIGAKDRRFIADTVWNIIRKRLKYSEMLHGNVSGRLLSALYLNNEDLDLIFNGEEYAPIALSKEEKALIKAALKFEEFSPYACYECPKWLFEKFDDVHMIEALNETAPVDVRTNFCSREQAKERLKKEGLFFSNTPLSPIGLRTTERINLNNCMTYQDGEIEVMDEGSQLLALMVNAKPHHKIIDYCAGAGGKALAIGERLHNEGIVWAHDISQERLSRIKKRAERLDILNIKIIRDVIDKDYDRFIIDAPCSGSGTWRRSPDAKYRLTPEKLKDICHTQAQLLEFGAAHTKTGGELIYMTCSVFDEENEQQIISFLDKHPEFCPLDHKSLWEKVLDIPVYGFDSQKWLHFSPLNSKTDGFFFCAMKKS